MRKTAFLAIFLNLVSFSILAHKQPMNVILFLVDDWGWTDAACFGSDLFETPNIDKLTESGVRFTNGYAACTVCSPSRSAIMTGLYPARTHVTDWIAGHSTKYENTPMLEPDWTQKLEHKYITIAEALKKHGYKTANFGKWHLCPDAKVASEETKAYWPEHHGFDVNVGGNKYGSPGSYFAPYGDRPNMPESKKGDHICDRLTDEAIKQLKKWKDDQFFIYFPFYSVHTPIQAKPELAKKYEAKIKKGMHHVGAKYAAMIETLDNNIGRMLETIDELGLSDNTLIILTGDNGGLMPDWVTITNNEPLRSGKGSVYEGGVRVPYVIKLPGGKSGIVNDTPVIGNDFFATILGALNINNGYKTDGVDLSPILKGESKTLAQRDLFWHYPHYHSQGATPYSAVRSGDYRLVEYHRDGNIELYNLADDIGEKNDLSRSMPDKVYELKTKLDAWRKEVGAQMAIANPEYDPTKPTLTPAMVKAQKKNKIKK